MGSGLGLGLVPGLGLGAAHLGCAACGVGTAPLATKGAVATLKTVLGLG